MCRAMEEMGNQAALERSKTVAKEMLSDGVFPLKKIAKYAHLSLDEVKALQANPKS